MAYEQIVSINNPDVAVGITLPFARRDGRLFNLSYSTEEQALSNLTNLILTRQGERIMQPFFGTTLQDSLFEQNDDELKSSIRESITEAVNFWLPYIAITELNVESVLAVGNSKEEHGVTISMKVSINGAQSETPITFLVTSSTIEQI
jgi:phage baseplate assembly protein W